MSGIPVQQSGTVTPGHATQWTTDGVVQDAGPATAGSLSELGITKEGGIALGVNNTSTLNNAPYVQWGVGVSDTGVITIYANSYGGAPAATLEYNINGVTYAFNPVGGGNVTGPSVAVSGDLVSFNGTSGQLVQDSGISGASLVSGPASAVSGHLATFNGTTGKIIEDGGSLTTAVDTILASPPAIGGTVPAAGSFTTLALTAALTVPYGGTGLTTLTAYSVLIGNGVGAVATVAPGTAGNVLTSNGASANPTFQAPAALFSELHVVTSSRALNTTYTNTTGKPMFVTAWLQSTTGTAENAGVYINGTQVSIFLSTSNGQQGSVYGMVPAGATYSVTISASLNLNQWTETY